MNIPNLFKEGAEKYINSSGDSLIYSDHANTVQVEIE